MVDKQKNIDVENNPYYHGSPANYFNMTIKWMPVLLMIVLAPYTFGLTFLLIGSDFAGLALAPKSGEEHTFGILSISGCLVLPFIFFLLRGIGYLYKYLLRKNTLTRLRRRQRGKSTVMKFSLILSFLVFLAYLPLFFLGFAGCSNTNLSDCNGLSFIIMICWSSGIATLITFSATLWLGEKYLKKFDAFILSKQQND